MRCAAFFLLALAGCSAFAPNESERVLKGAGEPITLGALEQATRDFADRYVLLVADACDHVKRAADTPERRQRAHLIKLRSASSAFDIVTGPHPLKELLDLVVQVELQHIVFIEERGSERLFGARKAERMENALKNCREEIWALAARAMTEKKMDELRRLIREWRRENPAVESVAYVRFDQILRTPDPSAAATLLSGFGILDLSHLNPFNPAARSVDRATVLADDAFYLAKRLPMLLDWEAEAASGDILMSPQLKDLTSSITRIADRVDRLPQDLAREREELFKTLEEKKDTLREVKATMETGRALAVDVARAGEAFERTFHELNLLAHPPGKGDGPPPEEERRGRPFDIQEYAAAAAQLAETATRLQGLIAETRSLTDSPAVARRLEEAESAAARAVERAENAGRNLLGLAVAGGVLLLAVAFLGLLGYRVAAERIRGRSVNPR
ncbi:MAG TPA: hypothetical protein VF950_26115 [Planctomycetota bacterium]